MNEETSLNSSKLEKIIEDSKIEQPVIILGETHGNTNEYNCYLNLMKKIKSFYFLCEVCHIKPNPIFDHFKVKCEDRLIICDWSDEIRSRINNEIHNDYKIYPNHLERNKGKILKSLFGNEKEIIIGKKILKYLNQTYETIIVLIGHEHASERSYIHNVLKDKTEYIAFWKNTEHCKHCGKKLPEDYKGKYCCSCGANLYNLLIHKRAISPNCGGK